MDLNKAMIIGNVTRDPELRTTPGGQNVVSFGVATNFNWTDGQGQRQSRPEYHNIVAWRKLADICAQYLRKGSKVYIEGRMQTREWDGQDGSKKNRTEIIADNMIMLDGKNTGSTNTETSNQTNNTPPEPLTERASTPTNDNEIRIEDIPF